MDKYLKRALESLGLNILEANNGEIKNVSDIDKMIKEREEIVKDCLHQIEELKSGIIEVEDDILTLKEIKHQCKVEEYKELNPGLEIF